MPAGTRIGHVHLHVDDLERAMRFYRDGLGFGGLFIMRRFGMGDAGLDYPPHAIAFNTWAGPNAPRPPADAAGLRWFDIALPDAGTLAAVRERLNAIGAAFSPIDGGFETADSAGNRIRVVLG
jgi:catechol 2,3-dioxygenase